MRNEGRGAWGDMGSDYTDTGSQGISGSLCIELAMVKRCSWVISLALMLKGGRIGLKLSWHGRSTRGDTQLY